MSHRITIGPIRTKYIHFTQNAFELQYHLQWCYHLGLGREELIIGVQKLLSHYGNLWWLWHEIRYHMCKDIFVKLQYIKYHISYKGWVFDYIALYCHQLMTYLHQPYIFQVLSASSTWDRILESITPNTYDIQTWDIFFVTTEIDRTESQQKFAPAMTAMLSWRVQIFVVTTFLRILKSGRWIFVQFHEVLQDQQPCVAMM